MLAGVWCPYTLKGKTRPQSVATRTLSSELEKLASNHNSRFELNILGTFGSQFFPSVTYISSSGKPSDHPPTLPETFIEKLALTFKQCFFFSHPNLFIGCLSQAAPSSRRQASHRTGPS